MTVKSNENGDTLRLSTRDWIGLIMIASGCVVAFFARTEVLGAKAEGRDRSLRSELSIAAPAPAQWTRDNVHRIDGEIHEIKKIMPDIVRIDTNQRSVMQKQEVMAQKQDTMIESLAENKAILRELKGKIR